MSDYSRGFFEDLRYGARRSAEAVVPLLMDVIRPRSVVDAGCGTGEWLSVFRSLGASTILGVDGTYVNRDLLQIPPDCFHPHDLGTPLQLEETFDLAISLEVAEHLPPERADAFVESLTQLSPLVLFSAAIPGQGGRHHVNEQWPDYWAELFQKRGYVALEAIRPLIWANPDVEWWYRQNMLLYVHEEELQRVSAWASQSTQPGRPPLSLVHPDHYTEKLQYLQDVSNEKHEASIGLLNHELNSIATASDRMILIDDLRLETQLGVDAQIVSFIDTKEAHPEFPSNDTEALATLEALRADHPDYLVIAWPSFWWLEHFARFGEFLDFHFTRILDTPRSIVFRLE